MTLGSGKGLIAPPGELKKVEKYGAEGRKS